MCGGPQLITPRCWTDGPQSRATLNLPELLTETLGMSVSAPYPQTDRRLVFTSSQAARYLGVSLATIRRWTDAGHISCYRTPGGQRRFAREQLDQFITSMHRDGPSAHPDADAAVVPDGPSAA
jgi:excisionase family DNA binding protein